MAKQTLAKMLEGIRKADRRQVESQFQIANVLTAIKDHDLYEQDGYGTFSAMVQGELEFSPSTALKYVSFYDSYVRLRYTKDEILKLMQTFGWSKLTNVITKTDTKLGQRAIAKRIGDHDGNNLSVALAGLSSSEMAHVDSVLAEFGMETAQSGVRKNVTSSMLQLIEEYERLSGRKKKAA